MLLYTRIYTSLFLCRFSHKEPCATNCYDTSRRQLGTCCSTHGYTYAFFYAYCHTKSPVPQTAMTPCGVNSARLPSTLLFDQAARSRTGVCISVCTLHSCVCVCVYRYACVCMCTCAVLVFGTILASKYTCFLTNSCVMESA